MSDIERVDVLIVGSGPAGSSTALHLVKGDPTWAERIVVVDKAVHPREKLCGGGVTHMGQRVLAGLDLTIEVPYVPIREAKLVYKDRSFSIRGNPALVILRRDEFDHWLVNKAQAKGVTIRQGETVKEVTHRGDHIEVITNRTMYQAKVLVGADGSKSIVRTKLQWDDDSRVARLLEILTPERAQDHVEFRDNVAVFDFSPMQDDLQGYYWDFPSYIQQKPFMNRGVFDSRIRPERPKANLKQELEEKLAERDYRLADYKLKGHPIRWFDKNGRFAMSRVLLAGDAAGADPFLGEGISFALAYGDVAAASIIAAFSQQDFAFDDYLKRILDHHTLWQLPWRTRLARIAYRVGYHDRITRLGWRLVAFGVRWTPWRDPEYNPVEARKLAYES